MGRGAERKIVQNAIFHGQRHDNKILKVKTLLSRNFVVMAQAPIQNECQKEIQRGNNVVKLTSRAVGEADLLKPHLFSRKCFL